MNIVIPANLPLFMTATLVLLLTPGPVVLYVVARGIDQGRKTGIVSAASVALGDFCHVLAATFGLSAILLSSALAFDIVKYLGAAYLIYLGIRKLLDRQSVQSSEDQTEPGNLRRIFRQGVLVAVLNPKTALFFMAFLPQFVDPTRGAIPAQVLFLGLVFVAMSTTTNSSYALLAGTVGHWLKGNRRFLQVQRYVTGTIYIGLGLTAALAGNGKK